MKIWEYLQITPTRFVEEYAEKGLVDIATHPEFPLQMLTYGREAVYTNNWDAVIRKCRGIIFNLETDEIVARPFEKFFNLGTAGMPETNPAEWQFDGNSITGDPEVWEKMDGFLCTLYTYNGQSYIASKGSFDSTHAKWATAWYRSHVHGEWPRGYTPVFEGICSSLRIVVDYEDFEGLVLLGLVKIETGEELNHVSAEIWAKINGCKTPNNFLMTWQDARRQSLDPDIGNFEGYVLVWRRPGQTPFRLKVKYVDYLRLHRMVSGVSPKAIYRALSDPYYAGELNEWMNESTPWFSKFVSKWVRSLTARHDDLMTEARKYYNDAREVNRGPYENMGAERKAYAEEFKRHPEVAGIMFAMLDGKDASAVAWKLTKPMIKDSHPCVNASVLR